jgi:hypothetical protein
MPVKRRRSVFPGFGFPTFGILPSPQSFLAVGHNGRVSLAPEVFDLPVVCRSSGDDHQMVITDKEVITGKPDSKAWTCLVFSFCIQPWVFSFRTSPSAGLPCLLAGGAAWGNANGVATSNGYACGGILSVVRESNSSGTFAVLGFQRHGLGFAVAVEIR